MGVRVHGEGRMLAQLTIAHLPVQSCGNPCGRKGFDQEAVSRKRKALLASLKVQNRSRAAAVWHSYAQQQGKLFRTASDAATLEVRCAPCAVRERTAACRNKRRGRSTTKSI